MSQLIKGMYGGIHGQEFKLPSDLFGLLCGQMRSRPDKLTHNSGWYNKSGEKLGWGDLGFGDIQGISRELADGELFVILGERDSFWNFREGKALNLTEAEPGVDYVAEHAMYVIAFGKLYFVEHGGFRHEDTVNMCGIQFSVLRGSNAVKQLMT